MGWWACIRGQLQRKRREGLQGGAAARQMGLHLGSDLGLRVLGCKGSLANALGFRIQNSGFRVQVAGFKVAGQKDGLRFGAAQHSIELLGE